MKAIPIAEYLNRIDQPQVREKLGGPIAMRSVKRSPSSPSISLVERAGPKLGAAFDRKSQRSSAAASSSFVVDMQALEKAVDNNDHVLDTSSIDDANNQTQSIAINANPAEADMSGRVAPTHESIDVEALIAERLSAEHARIAEEIRTGLAALETHISDAVAKILVPFVDKRLTRQIIEALGDCLQRLGTDQHCGLVTVRGPERLLARLKQCASELAVDVEYCCEERVEVLITTSNTCVESQLQPWGALLASLD